VRFTRRDRIVATLVALIVTSAASAQGGGGGGGGGRRGGGAAAGTGDTSQAATLGGVVVDAENGSGLTAATVSLWTVRDSTLVTGAIAGRDGAFALRGIRPGRYYLRVSLLGYRTRFQDVVVAPGDATRALGAIALTVDAAQTEGVVVEGRRELLTVEIDRNVYRTEDMPVAAAGNATDVLRNIPSVEVDVDGNVSLRGNQNVAVQINGRPVMMSGDALANFLQTLPAGSIERVEIIANPSAKFDPEGMGGILNIELKSGEDRGLSGGVNAGAGTNDSYSLGGNISYGAGPWSISANYGFNMRSREMLGYRIQESRIAEPSSRLFAGDTGTSSSQGHSLNASIEYALTPEQSISLASRVGMRAGEGERTTTTSVYDASPTPLSQSSRTTTDDDTGLNMDHRLGYRWTIERRRHELTAELRYGVDTDDEASVAATSQRGGIASNPFVQRIEVDERNSDMEAKIDYVRPLWEDAKLEAGYIGSLRSIDNTYASRATDTAGAVTPDGRSNAFDFIERLHGAYAIVGQTLGDFDLQLGLRAEAVATAFDLVNTGESFDNDYFSLFPSALVGWRPGESTQLRLSYSKRITRPRTRLLNPFSTSTDPQFRRVGNPHLRPEYTHAVELSVNQFVPWGTIQLTPYARRTTDAIERFERVDSTGIVTATFENLGQVDAWGAELLTTARAGDWLSTVASVGINRAVTDASNIGVATESDALAWTARLTATANVGWGTSIQGSLFYRSPSDIVGGHADAHVMSDFAVTKTLLDDRARIGLRVNDPFNQAGMRSWRETDGYYIETERRWGGRSAMLTLSYLFGQQPRDAGRQRGGEEMEEVDW
jgi:outer membrane receptor protein involved in Fe transport